MITTQNPGRAGARRGAGLCDALRRAATPKIFSPASVYVLNHLYRLRESLCRWICTGLQCNSDLSRELDCWIDAYETACAEVETLRARLREMEGAS